MKFRFLAHIATALLVAAPVASSADEAVDRVNITLANFSFTPADIHLKAGQRVTMVFANKGSGGHDFTATQFFKAAQMDAATRARLGKKGRIDLAAGESAEVTLVPKAGTYKVKCAHFLHSGFGMTGLITVS
jgi:uncharacterized cupredoxin-like copper-binding protein